MKVTGVKHLSEGLQVYDVLNCQPHHNFLARANGSNNLIVLSNCGIMDEIEFMPGSNPRIELSKVMRIYRNVKRRIETRYMRMGELPGILFLVSSKKSEYDFLESYIKRFKGSPNFMVVDEPIWNVKQASPDGSPLYSGKKFNVAIGNKYLNSKILTDEEDPESYKKQGYSLIEVPIEHRAAFELDINAALMDLAGMALSSKSKFIYSDKLMKCINHSRKNPMLTEEIVLGFDDQSAITDYLEVSRLFEEDIAKPCFLHIDTSLSGDRTGIFLTTISGSNEVLRYNKGDVAYIKDLRYRALLAFALKASPGQQIPYYKIREFIYHLRDNLGVNLVSITADSFQSADMLQQLRLRGFDTAVLSVDRNSKPYAMTRGAINELRFETFPCQILEDELLDLEEDKMTGKIDHPLNRCLHGSTKIILFDKGIRRDVRISDLVNSNYGLHIKSVNMSNGSIDDDIAVHPRVTKYVTELVKIELITDEELLCTPNHPILCKGLIYKKAGALSSNDEVIKVSDDFNQLGLIKVKSVTLINLKQSEPVYDLESPRNNNFLLSNGMIVHNSKDVSDGLAGSVYRAATSPYALSMLNAGSDAEIITSTSISHIDRELSDLDWVLGQPSRRIIKVIDSDDGLVIEPRGRILDW